jgi:hypothetical protein
MSRAHRDSYLALTDVLVPTDNNTIGLWHFDRHLESTNGIRPVWNTCRLAPGKYNNGVLIQEATTNIYPRLSTALAFADAYDGTHYGFGSSTNITQVIDNTLSSSFKSSITKVSRTNSGVSQRDYVLLNIQTPLNDTRVISFWYYGTYGTVISPYNNDGLESLYYLKSDGTWSGGGTGVDIPVATNTWQKITVKMVSRGTSAGYGLTWMALHNSTTVTLNNTEYWAFAEFQLEDRDYSTPYITTSVTNEKLSHLIPPPATVSCWFKLGSIETRATTGDDRVLLWYAKVDDMNSFYDNVSWWQVYIPGGGNTLRLKCVNAQQALAVKTLDITNAELNIYDNAWHFLCVRFNGTNMCAGVLAGPDAFDPAHRACA